MNLVQRFEHWGDTHHPAWIDVIRMALGIFLCYMGYTFLNSMTEMSGLLSRTMSFSNFAIVLLCHYIVFAHLLGGFMLAIGLFTRVAAALQIPILIGALFFINLADAAREPYNQPLITVVVLMLLIYFLVAGNGPWSFEKFIDRDNQQQEHFGPPV